jgi:hypothetical protein
MSTKVRIVGLLSDIFYITDGQFRIMPVGLDIFAERCDHHLHFQGHHNNQAYLVAGLLSSRYYIPKIPRASAFPGG